MTLTKYVKNFGLPFQGQEDFRECYIAADVEAVLTDLDERLAEINPDNYTHEDVIALNNSSIDVCLKIRSMLAKEEQP